MRRLREIRKEHKNACDEIKKLERKGGGTPLPSDRRTYFQLVAVRYTLEWVHWKLIKTEAKGPNRIREIMGYRHYYAGPTFAVLYP